MAAAQKYKGKDLSLTIDGVEVNLDGTSVVLEHEEADTDAVTFAELGSGTPMQSYFTITAVTDYTVGGLWDTLWTNAGDDVEYTFRPTGTGTGKPEFDGTCTITAKPPVGGTANEVFTFEARLDIVGTPAMTRQV